MTGRILIIEDDETMRVTVGNFLARLGFDVQTAETGEGGLALAARQGVDLALVDLRLPDMSGLDVITRLADTGEDMVMVMMTAYPEVRTAVAALKSGAYDYINKPFDLEDLRGLIDRAFEVRRLRREVAWRRVQAGEGVGVESVGHAAAFRQLMATTERIAGASRVPVLILGESGTGKEHIAQAIHRLSARAGGPWVTVNCSALPEGLLEAEMFGHEKGAFTDARQARKGLLELADGGTLFLDEIGELPLSMQSKLLRVVQERAVRPIGAVNELPINVRVVSATHKDLAAEVQGGRFRQDLFYRLNVIQIAVPPLRERLDDLDAIGTALLARIAGDAGVAPVPTLSQEALELLRLHSFPGNVRELENLLHRALALSGGLVIDRGDLDLSGADLSDTRFEVESVTQAVRAPTTAEASLQPGALPRNLQAHLDGIERDILERALERHRFNRTAAGASLGLSLRQMRYRMARLGVVVGADLGPERSE